MSLQAVLSRYPEYGKIVAVMPGAVVAAPARTSLLWRPVAVSVPPTGRACVACGEWKSAEHFYGHKRGINGLTGRCKSCYRVYQQAWRENNAALMRERTRAYNRRHRAKNPRLAVQRAQAYRAANYVTVMAREARFREENRERLLARRRELRQQARERYTAYHYAWIARRKANGGSFTSEEWARLCSFYGGRCLACGRVAKLTVDHVVPVSRGGSDDISNLQPLCGPCNSRKGNRRIIDYRPFSSLLDGSCMCLS